MWLAPIGLFIYTHKDFVCGLQDCECGHIKLCIPRESVVWTFLVSVPEGTWAVGIEDSVCP
jgi:hypothetical protein